MATKPMTKTQLVAALAEDMGTDKKSAAAALDAMVGLITREVSGGGAVTLPGVGKIYCRERPERIVRNPATGEQIKKEEANEESEDKAKLELKDEGTLELLLGLEKVKGQEETVLVTGAMASLNVESERITASELAWRQSMLHVHGYRAVGMWTPRITILKRKRL